MFLKKALSIILTATLLISLMGMSFSALAVEENCIFVSVDGNDSNSGSIDSPLLTITAAKEKVKTLQGNATVYFREGKYTFNDTVEFTDSDKANVTYKAYGNEKVVFTSGTAYSGFEECTVNNGVKAFKKQIEGNAGFNALFSEKSALKRTRYPESGYLNVKDVIESDNTKIYWDNPEFFTCYKGFITNEKVDFSNMNDVVIRILHFWKDEMMTLTGFDEATNHLTLSRPSSMTINPGDRYFFENVFEALNEPGEWYLDKLNGVLYYVPYDGEQADTLTLWGSVTETMINVKGVDGISFENIIFRGNGFNIPKNNTEIDFPQAAIDVTSCINYSYADNFSVKNCEFRDIAACAILIGRAVKNASVSNSYFTNIGAQAVFVFGENVPVDHEEVTRDITIKNNIVSGFGRTFFNAVGILVIHANTVDVSNNEIHDGYYTAISVGWVWGYNYSVTYNNKICDNLIYNIGQGWLSDMGGIYTLGNQPGTVVSGNVIHNVAADPGEGGYGGWGIYLDEGSSEILVEKNLVFACGSESFHLHYGKNNTVRNNIFALSGEAQVRAVSKYEGHKTSDFYNNIYLTDGRAGTYSFLTDINAYTDNNNIFWDLTHGDNLYACEGTDNNDAMSLETALRKGYINNPVVADPKFKDAQNFDFELAEDSPAIMNGFEPWDYSKAGTIPETVIGVSLQGGQTPYNKDAHHQSYTKHREKGHFFVNIFNKVVFFFRKVADFISEKFEIIKEKFSKSR